MSRQMHPEVAPNPGMFLPYVISTSNGITMYPQLAASTFPRTQQPTLWINNDNTSNNNQNNINSSNHYNSNSNLNSYNRNIFLQNTHLGLQPYPMQIFQNPTAPQGTPSMNLNQLPVVDNDNHYINNNNSNNISNYNYDYMYNCRASRLASPNAMRPQLTNVRNDNAIHQPILPAPAHGNHNFIGISLNQNSAPLVNRQGGMNNILENSQASPSTSAISPFRKRAPNNKTPAKSVNRTLRHNTPPRKSNTFPRNKTTPIRKANAALRNGNINGRKRKVVEPETQSASVVPPKISKPANAWGTFNSESHDLGDLRNRFPNVVQAPGQTLSPSMPSFTSPSDLQGNERQQHTLTPFNWTHMMHSTNPYSHHFIPPRGYSYDTRTSPLTSDFTVNHFPAGAVTRPTRHIYRHIHNLERFDNDSFLENQNRRCVNDENNNNNKENYTPFSSQTNECHPPGISWNLLSTQQGNVVDRPNINSGIRPLDNDMGAGEFRLPSIAPKHNSRSEYKAPSIWRPSNFVHDRVDNHTCTDSNPLTSLHSVDSMNPCPMSTTESSLSDGYSSSMQDLMSISDASLNHSTGASSMNEGSNVIAHGVPMSKPSPLCSTLNMRTVSGLNEGPETIHQRIESANVGSNSSSYDDARGSSQMPTLSPISFYPIYDSSSTNKNFSHCMPSLIPIGNAFSTHQHITKPLASTSANRDKPSKKCSSSKRGQAVYPASISSESSTHNIHSANTSLHHAPTKTDDFKTMSHVIPSNSQSTRDETVSTSDKKSQAMPKDNQNGHTGEDAQSITNSIAISSDPLRNYSLQIDNRNVSPDSNKSCSALGDNLAGICKREDLMNHRQDHRASSTHDEKPLYASTPLSAPATEWADNKAHEAFTKMNTDPAMTQNKSPRNVEGTRGDNQRELNQTYILSKSPSSNRYIELVVSRLKEAIRGKESISSNARKEITASPAESPSGEPLGNMNSNNDNGIVVQSAPGCLPPSDLNHNTENGPQYEHIAPSWTIEYLTSRDVDILDQTSTPALVIDEDYVSPDEDGDEKCGHDASQIDNALRKAISEYGKGSQLSNNHFSKNLIPVFENHASPYEAKGVGELLDVRFFDSESNGSDSDVPDLDTLHMNIKTYLKVPYEDCPSNVDGSGDRENKRTPNMPIDGDFYSRKISGIVCEEYENTEMSSCIVIEDDSDGLDRNKYRDAYKSRLQRECSTDETSGIVIEDDSDYCDARNINSVAHGNPSQEMTPLEIAHTQLESKEKKVVPTTNHLGLHCDNYIDPLLPGVNSCTDRSREKKVRFVESETPVCTCNERRRKLSDSKSSARAMTRTIANCTEKIFPEVNYKDFYSNNSENKSMDAMAPPDGTLRESHGTAFIVVESNSESNSDVITMDNSPQHTTSGYYVINDPHRHLSHATRETVYRLETRSFPEASPRTEAPGQIDYLSVIPNKNAGNSLDDTLHYPEEALALSLQLPSLENSLQQTTTKHSSSTSQLMTSLPGVGKDIIPNPEEQIYSEEEVKDHEHLLENARDGSQVDQVEWLLRTPASLPFSSPTSDSEPSGSKLSDSKLPDSKLPDSKLPDSKLTDSKLSDSKLPGLQLSGSQLPVIDTQDKNQISCGNYVQISDFETHPGQEKGTNTAVDRVSIIKEEPEIGYPKIISVCSVSMLAAAIKEEIVKGKIGQIENSEDY